MASHDWSGWARYPRFIVCSRTHDTLQFFLGQFRVLADVPALAWRRETLAALLGPHRLFRECIHDFPLCFGFVAGLEVVLG